MVSFSKIPGLLRRAEDYFEIGIVRVSLSPLHCASVCRELGTSEAELSTTVWVLFPSAFQ
jgi:hypothetical protein